MAGGGGAAVVVGVVGGILIGSGAGAWCLGFLAFVGLMYIVGSRAGTALIKEAHTLALGPSVKMELSTWPIRTIRSPYNNRILVTVDVPGSKERTPLAECKPVWYTPGTANAPTRPGDLYGTISQGRTVLGVTEDGSCYLGRVRKNRPDRGVA
jgi:hypothetical protein